MIIAYTDGSGVNNPEHPYYGYGGWGSYILIDGKEIYLHEGYKNTTNNRMEMRAVLETLIYIKDKSQKVIIYSDSQYVVKSIMLGWIDKWESLAWDCKNPDLWKKIKVELDKYRNGGGAVILNHLRGHQKNIEDEHIFGNNIADALCDYKNFTEYKGDCII